jgi:osmotically inducible protein OsmC
VPGFLFRRPHGRAQSDNSKRPNERFGGFSFPPHKSSLGESPLETRSIRMAAIQRTASAVWRGELKTGSGAISAASGVLRDTPFSYATRFENARGTNPEELIAAAHAACFSMAFANYLSTQGHRPMQISTKATISLENGVIGKMHLETEGQVPGMTEAAFKQYASEAEKKCPVSNLLRPGLSISLDASLRS